MEPLHIESEGQKTPEINFDPVKGNFTIEGMSCSENSAEFYKPVLEWLDQYIQTPAENGTTINVNLEYFNTSSAKCLMDVFERLAELHQQGHPVTVNWYYEEDDEDMYIAAEDFSEVIGLSFNMCSKEEKSV